MFSMLGGFWSRISDIITGMFAIIPQTIYFLYASIGSVLDVVQYSIRKVAGLDTYYVGGQPVTGDMLQNFIEGIIGINGRYSALSTVFWSLALFGAIILFLSVIITIIKAHYNYDAQKANPMKVVGSALRAVATFFIVPGVTVIGVLLANVLLNALDTITTPTSTADVGAVFNYSSASPSTVFEKGEGEWGKTTYTHYDFFGFGAPTGTQTFSGLMFKAAAYDCNRVRYGGYTASRAGELWSDVGIFNSSLEGDAQIEDVANMIDFAFANNLHLNSIGHVSVLLKPEAMVLIPSYRYFMSKVWYGGTVLFGSFSKFNIGLVWYYYNLWSFNFLLGFIGMIMATTFMTNITLGLITRLFEATALFLCLGPIVGLMPIDGENAFKSWRKEFVGDVIMAYGAIIGMNLLFLFLPYLQQITFFDSSKGSLNSIMSMVFVIVALMAVKQLIQLVSNFIGGKDAVSAGAEAKKEAAQPAKKALEKTTALVAIGAKIAKFIPAVSAVAKVVDKGIQKAKQVAAKIAAAKAKAKQALSKNGQKVDVSKSTHDELKRQKIDELEEEKQQTQAEGDKQAAQKNSEGEKHTKNAEKEKQRAAQAQSAETKDSFEEWLQSDGDEDFEGASDAFDRKQARDLREKYRNDSKGVTPEEKQKLIDQATEEYSSDSASHHNRKADLEAKKAQEAFAEATRIKQETSEKVSAIQNQIDTVSKDDYVLDGYNIKPSKLAALKESGKANAPMLKSVGQTFLKFGGETIRAVGSVFGLDAMVKSLDTETKTLDNAKIVLRDFAQKLKIPDYQSKKAFQTHEQQAEHKKQIIAERATLSDPTSHYGSDYSRAMTQAATQLAEALRKYKNGTKEPKKS